MQGAILRGLLGFEWRQQRRQLAFWGTLLILPAFSLVLVGTGYGPGNTAVNAPYVVAQSLGFLTLIAIFAITIFTASGALRDTEHGMRDIVRATAVTRLTLLAGRYLGIVLASCAGLAAAIATLAIAPYLIPPDPARIIPFRPAGYLYGFMVVGLPNVVLIASTLFAVAVFTRRTLPTYVGGVTLYALYFMVALAIDSPLLAGTAPQSAATIARAALLDPFGISAFFAETRLWTPEQRNTALLPLWGPLVLNRALWLGVSALILALVARIAPRDRRRPAPAPSATDAGRAGAPYAAVPVADATGASWGLFRPALGLELKSLLGTWSFAVLALLWVMFIGIELVSDLGRDEYGTRLLAATMLILRRIREPLVPFVMASLVYLAAEVAWRERVTRVADLIDATAGRRAPLILAKFGALVSVIGLLIGVSVAIGVGYQLLHGYDRLELGAYTLLLLQPGIALAQFAALTLFLQVISPNRYVGMVLSVAALALLQAGSPDVIGHPLVLYSTAPVFGWSDIAGVSAAFPSFLAFSGYWSLAAWLLLLITIGAWPRGHDTAVRARLAGVGRALGTGGRRTLAGLMIALVMAASLLARETLLGDRFETPTETAAWRAAYERRYAPLRSLPTPSLRHVTATIHLVPAERRWTARGSASLVNETFRPIDTVWVAVRRDVTIGALALEGGAGAARDDRYGMHAFVLRPALAPGDTAALTFELAAPRRMLSANSFSEAVAPNGTFLVSLAFLPTIGFRNGYTLIDPRLRTANGLPASAPPAGAMEGDADNFNVRAMLDLTIVTDPGQVAHTTGELVASAPGRYRYRTTVPVRPFFAITSARHAALHDTADGVPVTLYYAPEHASNARAVLTATTTSLRLFNAEFGRYDAPSLRVVEVPATVGFAALALPGVIYLNEARGMLTDLTDTTRVDLVTRRLAHEVGHQWWGHRLSPASGPGATLLVESLAKYAEQLAVGRLYGPFAVAEMVAYDEDRYIGERGAEASGEPPLTEVRSGQAYLYYGKGGVVMHGVAGVLGEVTLHQALRALLAAHTDERSPATAATLVALLRDAAQGDTSASERIDEDFGQLAVWDFAAESLVSTRRPDGRFDVVVGLRGSKWLMQDGHERPAPFRTPVTILLRSGDPRWPLRRDDVIHTESREVRDGSQALRFVLPTRPSAVVVDPYMTRVDRDRGNNSRMASDQ